MLVVPNLLVTDDDRAFREIVCEGLARRGFHVTQASDGAEAIEVIGQHRVHMALLDVHMPRVTGLDVIRHLHQQPGSPPCVLMSGKLDDQIRQEAERMRAYQVLSKPIRLKRLTDVICAALTEIYGWQPPANS